MTAPDFVLSLIAGFGGQVQGRTLLQKRAYFVQQLAAVPLELGFDAHYYGPYSAAIDNSVARLKSLAFIEEENTGFGVATTGFEIKRYDYRLTEDGRKIVDSLKRREDFRNIERACRAIIQAGDPNYFVLSVAAKADFILGRRGKAMTSVEIIKEAEKFDWNIPRQVLDTAVDFLSNLGMIRRAEEKAS